MLESRTLTRFILDAEKHHPEATGELTALLSHVSLASKVIHREVSKAGLVDILGYTGEVNVQGEEVKKLDVFANRTLIAMFQRSGLLAGMASEEVEEIIAIPEGAPRGKYVIAFDPLDGSSNIDVNVNIGTIFSIHRRQSTGSDAVENDFLQPGREQICAGYVLYGTSTMLVMSTGQGVHGFTLDPSIGEFLLSHPRLQIPPRGNIYSINEGNSVHWHEGTRSYIEHLKADDKATGRPYKGRYIGSLVADFHRTLCYGGIFLYPGDRKAPEGKLRLLYEAAPLAFLAEQAGGRASTGKEDILDLQPTSLHQRVPLIFGSREDVEEVERFEAEAAGA